MEYLSDQISSALDSNTVQAWLVTWEDAQTKASAMHRLVICTYYT